MRHVPRFVALLTVVAATMTSTAGLASAATLPGSAVTPVWGTYQSVAPARVLDTRIGKGVRQGPIAAGGSISLAMPAASGVPATGVSAVVLNVTVTAATRSSFLTVWPAGTTRPTASSINFVAATNRANLVTVPLGTVGSAAGKITIYNPLGSVQVIADVMGYYVADGAATAGGFYERAVPERLLDTRDPSFGGAVESGWSVSVPVDYNDPATGIDINSHITALAVNITAVLPTKPGYLASWDGGSVLPITSTLNFAAGTITPNMAVVPVGPCVDCGTGTGLPSITVVNRSAGSVHMLVDIVGFFDDGQLVEGLRFKPLTPTRIVDTRTGLGTTTLAAGQTRSITAPPSVAGNDTYSLVTNTTDVAPTLSGFLTLWADGDAMPVVSNLNAAKGQIVANATITDVGMGNVFNVYNNRGTTNAVVDVVGTMEYVPSTPPAAALSAAAAPRIWKNQITVQPVR